MKSKKCNMKHEKMEDKEIKKAGKALSVMKKAQRKVEKKK